MKLAIVTNEVLRGLSSGEKEIVTQYKRLHAAIMLFFEALHAERKQLNVDWRVGNTLRPEARLDALLDHCCENGNLIIFHDGTWSIELPAPTQAGSIHGVMFDVMQLPNPTCLLYCLKTLEDRSEMITRGLQALAAEHANLDAGVVSIGVNLMAYETDTVFFLPHVHRSTDRQTDFD